jgi:hypothetical protein
MTTTDQTITPTIPRPDDGGDPVWCTFRGLEHEWDQDLDGTWTRMHEHAVGRFSVAQLERCTTDGRTFDAPSGNASLSTFDSAKDAHDLAADLEQIARVFEWPEPRFPEPVDAPVPAWATIEPVDDDADARSTRVFGWLWVTVDDVWERTVRRPFRWDGAGGFDVASIQNASADGTVTTPPPEIWLDLKDDTIDNAADARQLGQWLIEAAEVMEAIEGESHNA